VFDCFIGTACFKVIDPPVWSSETVVMTQEILGVLGALMLKRAGGWTFQPVPLSRQRLDAIGRPA